MNRLELLSLLLLLGVAIIFVLKSKWFDRVIGSLLRGTQSTSVSDIKADSTRVKADAQTLQQNLDTEAARIEREKADLKTL